MKYRKSSQLSGKHAVRPLRRTEKAHCLPTDRSHAASGSYPTGDLASVSRNGEGDKEPRGMFVNHFLTSQASPGSRSLLNTTMSRMARNLLSSLLLQFPIEDKHVFSKSLSEKGNRNLPNGRRSGFSLQGPYRAVSDQPRESESRERATKQ